jgi:hypothetical protein
MTFPEMDSDVYFGEVGEPASWDPILDDTDPDDEELNETPEDVIGVLGFDPKDEDDSSPVKNEFEVDEARDDQGRWTSGGGGKDGDKNNVNVYDQEEWEEKTVQNPDAAKAFQRWGLGVNNHDFRLTAIGRGPDDPKTKAQYAAFSQALKAAPDWQGTAYRGTWLSGDLIKKIHEGGTLVLKGPQSFTASEHVALGAASNPIFGGLVPKDSAAAIFEVDMKHGADIHRLVPANVAHELEIVNKGPAKYKITKVDTMDNILNVKLEEMDA